MIKYLVLHTIVGTMHFPFSDSKYIEEIIEELEQEDNKDWFMGYYIHSNPNPIGVVNSLRRIVYSYQTSAGYVDKIKKLDNK